MHGIKINLSSIREIRFLFFFLTATIILVTTIRNVFPACSIYWSICICILFHAVLIPIFTDVLGFCSVQGFLMV